jgi:hypothetical protein
LFLFFHCGTLTTAYKPDTFRFLPEDMHETGIKWLFLKKHIENIIIERY